MINVRTYHRSASLELDALWEDVFNRVLAVLNRYTSVAPHYAYLPNETEDEYVKRTRSQRSGTIPVASKGSVIAEAQTIISDMIVGDGTVYTVADDRAYGVSPYAVVLLGSMYGVQQAIFRESRSKIESRLSSDVVDWLRLDTSAGLYPPLYAWKDPRGYDLKRRIVRANRVARDKIRLYLQYHITAGSSITRMAKDLRALFIPSMKVPDSVIPRGTNIGFDTSRLLINEISRSHAEATFEVANGDPYVDGIDWALSPRHPRFDICDGLATIGMSGQRLREPYEKESAPQVVRDSHVRCICQNRLATSYTKSKDDEILALFTAGLIFHNIFNRLYD